MQRARARLGSVSARVDLLARCVSVCVSSIARRCHRALLRRDGTLSVSRRAELSQAPRKRAARPADDDDDSEGAVVVNRRKSKGKKRARPSNENDEDNSDDQGEGTSKRKTKKPKHPAFTEDVRPGSTSIAESTQEVIKKAQDFVRLALFAETKRRPLKRAGISKLLGTGSVKNFNVTLAAAQKIAVETLGMDLIELRPKGKGVGSIPVRDEPEEGASQRKGKQRKDDSSSGDDDGMGGPVKKATSEGKSYMLRSCLPDKVIAACGETSAVPAPTVPLNPEDQSTNFSRVEGFHEADVKSWREYDGAAFDWKHSDQLQHIGLIHVILALILVNERKLSTQRLFAMLRNLQIEEKTRLPSTPAAASINVMTDKFTFDSFLKELGTAGYLESRDPLLQSTNVKDPEKREWRWGARAEAEIGERNIGQFIAEVLKTSDDDGEREKQLKAIHKAAGSKLQNVTATAAVSEA